MGFFELSMSMFFGIGKEGRSSDLLALKAFVITRGMKREDRGVVTDGTVSVRCGCGILVVDGVAKGGSTDDVEGRRVE